MAGELNHQHRKTHDLKRLRALREDPAVTPAVTGPCSKVDCYEDAVMALTSTVALRNGKHGVGHAFVCREHAMEGARELIASAEMIIDQGFESIERQGERVDDDD